MKAQARLLAFTLLAGCLPVSVQADTVTLSASADTCLFSFAPDANMGASSTLILGGIQKSGHRGRMLVRFDLRGKIPADAIIRRAALTLTVVKENFSGPNETVGAHRVLRDWGEGGKSGSNGDAATGGEATWKARFFGGENWGVPGGQAVMDHVATASASRTLDGPDSYVFDSTPDLVTDVQKWVGDPAVNFGWLLISADEDTALTARRIASREDAPNAPTLTVEFDPPPPPPVPVIDSFTRNGPLVELRFRAGAGNIYAVEFRESPVTGPWQPLSNVISKFFDVDAVVTDAIDAAPLRLYRLGIVGQVD